MTPLVPLAGGALALLAAALLLRSYGSRYRIARLLATVPEVSLADAIAAGEAGRPVYVRVAGRLDSEEAFEDAARRPLVYRRTRLQVRSRGRWATFEDSREQVPFEIGDGLRAIASGTGNPERLELRHVADTADIKEGDLLVSSGLGQRFPAGYPVATVKEVIHDSGQPFAIVRAVPTAALNRSRYMLLVFSDTRSPEERANDAAKAQAARAELQERLYAWQRSIDDPLLAQLATERDPAKR